MPLISTAGGSSVAVVLVAAAVKPSAVFKFDVKASRIAIGEADIAAGYIELPANSILSMKTPGVEPTVVVDFAPDEGLFKSVEVKTTSGWRFAQRLSDYPLSSANLNVLPAAGAGKALSAANAATESLASRVPDPRLDAFTALSYRFNLGSKALPGTYPVPMTLNINL